MPEDVLDRVHSVKCMLAADVARAQGMLRLRVTGSSMLPSIWPGDILIVERREIGEVRPSETALFLGSGRLVAHRVVAHQGSFLVTQGDGVPAPDPEVAAKDLLGVVTAIERGGRRLAPEDRRSAAGRVSAALARRSGLAGRLVRKLYTWSSRGAA